MNERQNLLVRSWTTNYIRNDSLVSHIVVLQEPYVRILIQIWNYLKYMESLQFEERKVLFSSKKNSMFLAT